MFKARTKGYEPQIPVNEQIPFWRSRRLIIIGAVGCFILLSIFGIVGYFLTSPPGPQEFNKPSEHLKSSGHHVEEIKPLLTGISEQPLQVLYVKKGFGTLLEVFKKMPTKTRIITAISLIVGVAILVTIVIIVVKLPVNQEATGNLGPELIDPAINEQEPEIIEEDKILGFPRAAFISVTVIVGVIILGILGFVIFKLATGRSTESGGSKTPLVKGDGDGDNGDIVVDLQNDTEMEKEGGQKAPEEIKKIEEESSSSSGSSGTPPLQGAASKPKASSQAVSETQKVDIEALKSLIEKVLNAYRQAFFNLCMATDGKYRQPYSKNNDCLTVTFARNYMESKDGLPVTFPLIIGAEYTLAELNIQLFLHMRKGFAGSIKFDTLPEPHFITYKKGPYEKEITSDDTFKDFVIFEANDENLKSLEHPDAFKHLLEAMLKVFEPYIEKKPILNS